MANRESYSILYIIQDIRVQLTELIRVQALTPVSTDSFVYVIHISICVWLVCMTIS